MEYLGAGGQVVNSPNVNKGITALGININLNSYIENIKNKILWTLQTFHTISREHYKHKQDKKLEAQCHASKKKKSYWEIFMCQERKNCWQSVIRQRKEKLLAKCHASKIYITER